MSINSKYPGVSDLRAKAKTSMPKFAFDYLEGGSNEEYGLAKNINAIREIELRSHLLSSINETSLATTIMGHTYSAPFGIAPIGLQGLMWPKSPEILAKAALDANIPYVLSTVSSSSIERIAQVSEGQAWYQLYNPTKEHVRLDLMKRLKNAGYKNLMITVDVPTFGYRHNDIKNGLSMPPQMNVSNVIQMLKRPRWLVNTLLAGKPEMETLKPYMDKNMPSSELANFMNNTVMGKVDTDSLQLIRDLWPGNLIIKGVISEADVASSIALGADGVVVSNHGARQLDVGEAPIRPLASISKLYGNKIAVMMDSGLRSGPDVACAIASGAQFTFLGRAFVYGVAALGKQGGDHTIDMLKKQLTQLMAQLRCKKISHLPQHLVK